MPELLVKAWMNRPQLAEFRKTIKYNWLCAISGGFYIILMMIANLVGFSFGYTGFEIMMEELFTWDGLAFIIQAHFWLTIGVFIMFAIRREEEMAAPGPKLLKGF
jgi:hypothetical protein